MWASPYTPDSRGKEKRIGKVSVSVNTSDVEDLDGQGQRGGLMNNSKSAQKKLCSGKSTVESIKDPLRYLSLFFDSENKTNKKIL